MPTVNAINFRTVFDDLSAKLADNPAVLSTVLVILFIYVLGLVWARRMDKKDIEKVGVKSLPSSGVKLGQFLIGACHYHHSALRYNIQLYK